MKIFCAIACTVVAGIFGTASEVPEQGAVIAIAVMGGFILATIDKNKKS